MKKKLLALILAVATAFTVGGCSSTNNNNLVMATGGTSGTYYPFGGAIAAQINKNVEGTKVTATSTGASKENIRNIASGESDLALVQNDILDYAVKGIEIFDGEKTENLAVMANLYPEVVQIVVGADSGINTIADLKGKRVSVGDVGSGVEANAKQLLEANGLTFDDLKTSHLSFKESANGFKDKQLDAFFVTAGVPNTAVTELSVTDPIKVLSVDAATTKALIEKYPFYTEYTISKDAYNTAEDVKTVAVMATLIVRADLDEDIVYDMTKAIFDNIDDLGLAHAKGKEVSVAGAVNGISVDIHPGAVKYFKEVGAIK